MSTATEPQHLVALAKANRIRLARAGYRRELASATSMRESLDRFLTLLEDPPLEIASARVEQLLSWCWRMGPYKARTLLAPVLTPQRKGCRVDQLTPHERRRIAEAVWRVIARCER